MLSIEKHLLTDFGEAARREWLETNGLGGYASATLAGALARGCHGLLVARPEPLAVPHVLLATLEEALVLHGRRVAFSTQQYHDVVYPHGYCYLEKFRLDPFPVWTYCVEGFRFEKMVFLVHAENTVVLVYQPLVAAEVRFELRPLLAYRDYRQRQHENPHVQPSPTQPYQAESGLLELTPYAGMPPLRLLARHGEFIPDGYWYRHFKYPADERAGLAAEEDLYSYGVLALNLDALHPTAYLIATTEDYTSVTLERLIQMRRRELNRRAQILDAVPRNDEFLRNLALATDAFLTTPPTRKGLTITPGYPGPADGDSPILASLPGLTLSTRRFDKAKAVLETCLDRDWLKGRSAKSDPYDDGSLACPPDEPLWLVYALYQYARATLDYDFVLRRAYPVVAEWLAGVPRGDSPGLALEGSHLLAHTIRSRAVVAAAPPASGVKTVETNALWYNVLYIMAQWAEQQNYSNDGERLYARARAVRTSFQTLFWNAAVGYLYDAVIGDRKDATLCPYQLLAVGLPFDLLRPEQARTVIEAVRTRLLTPYGLRAREPAREDPSCRAESDRPAGHIANRPDNPNTLWPWLLGPFVTAYLKVYGQSHVRRHYLESLLRPLRAHLREAGIGMISERFLADGRVEPDGCAAQARSVAELFRVGLLLANGGVE